MGELSFSDEDADETMQAIADKLPPALQPFGRELIALLRPQLLDLAEKLFADDDLADEDVTMELIVDRIVRATREADLSVLGIPPDIKSPVDAAEWLAPLRAITPDTHRDELLAIRQEVFEGPIQFVADVMRDHIPPNWHLTQLVDTLRLVVSTPSLPLIDVPDAATVHILVAAARDGDDVIAALLNRSDEVLDSLEPLADGTTLERRHLAQSIAAIRAGLHLVAMPAVILACDVLTRELTARDARSSDLLSNYRVDNELDIPVHELRRILVLHCATRIYSKWYPSSNQPLPDNPSRHVIAHTLIDDDERARRDALLGVLLLGNLIIVSDAPMP